MLLEVVHTLHEENKYANYIVKWDKYKESKS